MNKYLHTVASVGFLFTLNYDAQNHELKIFANVVHFYKLYMITSLCSVIISQSEKYIVSPFYLTAISYCFLLAHLSYYSTLLSWRSNKVRMLHNYMSEFQCSEMWCDVVGWVGPDMLKGQEVFLDCLTLKTKTTLINPLMPNDHYSGRTALLTSKRCILYIYSTNIVTEYFKHGIYSPFFSSKCSLFHNSNIFGSCFIHILYTECAKI